VHAAVHREQPERELVLGMWYHYLSQSQARTPRSIVGALYYAHVVAHRRTGCHEYKTRERVASIHCATCRIYSYYTCRLGVCASPRELEISPLRRRRRLSQHSRLLRAHVRENAPERKRATPRFRSPLEPVPRGRENRSRSRANACNRTVSSPTSGREIAKWNPRRSYC